MAEAAIPADIFNPGQVLACMGFLEAADTLCGDAEGGFDWRDESDIRFTLRACGDDNPFETVLNFLAEATVVEVPVPRRVEPTAMDGANEIFPASSASDTALPIRLHSPSNVCVELSHWIDGSSRDDFKLYAGNRSAFGIAGSMLGFSGNGNGVRQLLSSRRSDLIADPLGIVVPMGGSFNFDPRGGWTSIDAGYSPNSHGIISVTASPVVEILAAWGLQHARPDEYETRKVRYSVWSGLLPPLLARPALAGESSPFPMRLFNFELTLSGKNKVVTFAEEISR